MDASWQKEKKGVVGCIIVNMVMVMADRVG